MDYPLKYVSTQGSPDRESRFSQIDSRGTVRNARTGKFWIFELDRNDDKIAKQKLFRNNLIISDWTERGPTNIEDHRPDKDQVNSGIGPSLGLSRNL